MAKSADPAKADKKAKKAAKLLKASDGVEKVKKEKKEKKKEKKGKASEVQAAVEAPMKDSKKRKRDEKGDKKSKKSAVSADGVRFCLCSCMFTFLASRPCQRLLSTGVWRIDPSRKTHAPPRRCHSKYYLVCGLVIPSTQPVKAGPAQLESLAAGLAVYTIWSSALLS